MQDIEFKLRTEFFDVVNGLQNTINEQADTIFKLAAENRFLREKYEAILNERIEELKKRNDKLLLELNVGKEQKTNPEVLGDIQPYKEPEFLSKCMNVFVKPEE